MCNHIRVYLYWPSRYHRTAQQAGTLALTFVHVSWSTGTPNTKPSSIIQSISMHLGTTQHRNKTDKDHANMGNWKPTLSVNLDDIELGAIMLRAGVIWLYTGYWAPSDQMGYNESDVIRTVKVGKGFYRKTFFDLMWLYLWCVILYCKKKTIQKIS